MLPYDEVGRGPALVLLHAGIADRTMWSEHLDALAESGHRVIAVDLPAFGEAPPRDHPEWEAVLETMDQLSVQRAALAGNSFGGAVAMRIAALAPERVSALALFSAPPPAFEPSPQLTAVWEAEEAALERGDIEDAVEAILDAWLLPDAPAEQRERVARMQRRAFELQAGLDAERPPDPLEEDPALLGGVEAPVLVAAGEHDLPDFRDGAEAISAAIPGARRTMVPGAGHLAPLETPEVFRRLLIDFLATPPGPGRAQP